MFSNILFVFYHSYSVKNLCTVLTSRAEACTILNDACNSSDYLDKDMLTKHAVEKVETGTYDESLLKHGVQCPEIGDWILRIRTGKQSLMKQVKALDSRIASQSSTLDAKVQQVFAELPNRSQSQKLSETVKKITKFSPDWKRIHCWMEGMEAISDRAPFDNIVLHGSKAWRRIKPSFPKLLATTSRIFLFLGSMEEYNEVLPALKAEKSLTLWRVLILNVMVAKSEVLEDSARPVLILHSSSFSPKFLFRQDFGKYPHSQVLSARTISSKERKKVALILFILFAFSFTCGSLFCFCCRCTRRTCISMLLMCISRFWESIVQSAEAAPFLSTQTADAACWQLALCTS